MFLRPLAACLAAIAAFFAASRSTPTPPEPTNGGAQQATSLDAARAKKLRKAA